MLIKNKEKMENSTKNHVILIIFCITVGIVQTSIPDIINSLLSLFTENKVLPVIIYFLGKGVAISLVAVPLYKWWTEWWV